MANLLYNLAQPFSDTKQYTQGAIVIYNDRMYEMTADEYTPGPFDPEKFTERFLSEMISGKLNSNLINEKSGTATCGTNGWYDITLGKKPIAFIVYFYTDSPDVKFSWIGNNPNDFIMNQYLYSDVQTEKDNSKRNAVVITDTGFSVKYSGYNASKTISWWAIF